MMQVLSPTYTLRLEIRDKLSSVPIDGLSTQHPPALSPPAYKFFDGLNGKTGCDEVLAAVKSALEKSDLASLDISLSLERFEHK